MLNMDAVALVAERQRELIEEANRVRLASELPQQASVVRRELATVCYRLAHWLDEPAGYVRMPEPGPEDWATPWAGV
jgi:hypothetical protein